MVQILASGVFFSGFLKDLLCLPRPLSPPLQRITMSGSAALEYGFPSTHSTNAVSVAVYVLLSIRDEASTLSSTAKTAIEVAAYFYATSIVLGRLYCGMHGVLDVVVGSALGVVLSLIQVLFVDSFDLFIRDGQLQAVFIFTLVVLVLVRIHPEPVDDCPCFDDSVAFAGVILGIEIGAWHFASTQYSSSDPVPGTTPFDYHQLGLLKVITRPVFGVCVLFAWRLAMKTLLLNALPPLFRIGEKLGLNLPRKFFKSASYVVAAISIALLMIHSEYDKVPQPIETDNVMPSVTALPNFISSIRHPGRSRSVSIGPQSAADAYEALAFRQKKRRESRSGSLNLSEAETKILRESEASERPDVLRPARVKSKSSANHLLPTPVHSEPDLVAKANSEAVIGSPLTPNDSDKSVQIASRTPSQDRRENEKDEREIFSQLPKPRVRYDVEVITKLIVYSGKSRKLHGTLLS
jgi:dihydrosphingosine 1-phosphate phosphatase